MITLDLPKFAPELYAKYYSQYKITGTPYLAFRDIPGILRKYVQGNNAVDYGCGSGESTIFLKSLGFNVTGVDINKLMLKECLKKDPRGTYLYINSANIPLNKANYDLVFSSFVLLEIDNKPEILHVLQDINRILKSDGIFIAIVANENTYKYQWLTLNTNFPDNKTLNSGSKVKIEFCDIGLSIYDYYWSEADYTELISKAGFKLLEIHKPLGSEKDAYIWKDEKLFSPYSIYICQN